MENKHYQKQLKHLETYLENIDKFKSAKMPNVSIPKSKEYSTYGRISELAFYLCSGETLLGEPLAEDHEYSEIDLSLGDPIYKVNKIFLQDLQSYFTEDTNVSKYPRAIGSKGPKSNILKYFKEEFDLELKHSNIISTIGTKHGYVSAIKAILNKDDYLLMPTPTYGLFTFQPEQLSGGHLEVIECTKDNDYRLTAEQFESKVIELKNEGKNVKALALSTPTNPLGYVYTKIEVESFLKICKKHDIWFIDDIVYRGTEFETINSTVPAITLKITEKVITMIGMSKAYGIPNMRVGILIAPEEVIYEIKDDIFNVLNSTPDLNLYLIGKIFEEGNMEYYELYLKDLNKHYIKNNEILNYIINGKFENRYKDIYPDTYRELEEIKTELPKIQGVKSIGQPEAGFFKVLDFSCLLGKKYKDIAIQDSYDFAKTTLKYFNVKVLSSYGMLWPDDTLAIRFSLAEDITFTIEGLKRIGKIINEAK